MRFYLLVSALHHTPCISIVALYPLLTNIKYQITCIVIKKMFRKLELSEQDYFFAFFLRVTQPFFADSDLDNGFFFATVFFAVDFFDAVFFAGFFLAVAICYEFQNSVFD